MEMSTLDEVLLWDSTANGKLQIREDSAMNIVKATCHNLL